jgi:rfaE bifunctional protein kinase chain/domain
MENLSPTKLESLSNAFTKARIAVIGDLMLDRYVFGHVNRLSPEAPVPILDFLREETRLGGAANVAHNIKTLGGNVLLFGVIGNHSGNNQLFISKCNECGMTGGDIDGVIEDESRTTTVKTRYISSFHHLRVDYESRIDISEEMENKLLGKLEEHFASIDAIILEDYNKGVLTKRLIKEITSLAKNNGIPVFVDPKHDNFFEYKDATVFKPNRKEMEDALGRHSNSEEKLREAGFKLLDMLQAENILLTLSDKGMLLFERGEKEPFSIPTRAREVADVSGAGDTVIATLALANACGATIREAAMMANRAAGLVIEELGIVPIYKEQLFGALVEDLENV